MLSGLPIDASLSMDDGPVLPNPDAKNFKVLKGRCLLLPMAALP